MAACCDLMELMVARLLACAWRWAVTSATNRSEAEITCVTLVSAVPLPSFLSVGGSSFVGMSSGAIADGETAEAAFDALNAAIDTVLGLDCEMLRSRERLAFLRRE